MTPATVRGQLAPLGLKRVFGWAADAGGEPVWVEILVNGEPRARIRADQLRRDLVRRKLHHNARCGFEWTPPADSPLLEGDEIRVRVADSGVELQNSPQIQPSRIDVERPPAPRLRPLRRRLSPPAPANEPGAPLTADASESEVERPSPPIAPPSATDTPAAPRRGSQRRRIEPTLSAAEPGTTSAPASEPPPAEAAPDRQTTPPAPTPATAADAPTATRRRNRRRRRKPALPLTELAPTLLTDKTQARIASEEDVARLPQMPLLPPASKRNSWQIFQHSLWAFFLRDLRSRYSEYRLGYFWAIVQPLAYLVLIRQVRHLIGGGQARDPYDVSFTWFLALGIIPFFMFQHSFHRCLGAMSSFKGMYAYRQLKPIDVVLARVAIEALTMAALFVMLWIGFWWLDLSFDAEDPLEFLAAISLLLLFGLGVGLLADVYVTRDRELRQVFQLAERPLLFISGIFFVIDDLPEGAKPYLLWNPLLHAIDLARGAMLSHYDSPGSWTYLIGSTIVVLLLGLAAYRRNLNALTQ